MNTMTEAQIEADPTLPIIRMFRDFSATPAQLVRAHTDPELFAQWVGPDRMDTRIDYWDAKTGGAWRYVMTRDGVEFAFRGTFHEVRPDRIVNLGDIIDLAEWMADFPGGEFSPDLRIDGVHFTESGYRFLADRVAEFIKPRAGAASRVP